MSALDEPALLARHNAAITLLRHGREVDGLLLLSYVVWPSANLDAAHAAVEPASVSAPAESRSAFLQFA